MKRIYFVRHAESTANASGISQGGESVLSEDGNRQAFYVRGRFASIPIEVILTSSMPRAVQTARIIRRDNGVEIIESSTFAERKKPSVIIGKSKEDPEVKAILKYIYEKYPEEEHRHSDEENPRDLISRADRAIETLLSRSEENILVVTHGVFLKVLLARFLFGKDLSGRELLRFMRFVSISNTGITIIELRDEDEAPAYDRVRLITLNDHAHLGDPKK